VSAEIMAVGGFDYACIDMQHGLIDYSDTVPMLQAISTGHTTAVVRVPENQPGWIGKALDAGAMAVIVPMVNTPDECAAMMRSGRYAPLGSRSYGPSRAAPLEGADYWERANAEVCLIPMIETVGAVEAIDDILAVPGVEAIYVGPADLAVSMGLAPRGDTPEFLAMLDRIVAACGRHGVIPGIHTTVPQARDRIDRGFRMVTITGDLAALRARLSEDLSTVRGAAGDAANSIY
jgi:4-hydroxy-2-oxoheptanedioate aldolase